MKVILAASKLILVQIDCGLSVTDNIICLYAWFIDLRLKLFIDLLSSRVNDLLKFWNSETIGALSHRPIVLTDAIDYRTIGFSHNRPNPKNLISSFSGNADYAVP